MRPNYYIWIEIQANKKTIVSKKNFQDAMQKCVESGIGSVILSVKDTSGFTIYNSKIAPHYSLYDKVFEEKDYLRDCIQIVHSLGMRFYANFDVFVEGNKKNKHTAMAGLNKNGWMTEVYGVDSNGNGVIKPTITAENLHTVGSIDDFGEIFVNPANEEVCDYELSLIEEVINRYEIDGIVLDRVRYVGLSSDFSDLSRIKWEEFTGIKSEVWPEDIYTFCQKDNEMEPVYGKYFGEFLEFRANVIGQFIKRVHKLTKDAKQGVEFMDYTGSWYPLYYEVGANWASAEYIPTEYPWVNAKEYAKTGYAEEVDGLLSGFYYEDVTEREAKEHGQSEYWYSVEGSARMASLVTNQNIYIIGSLYLEQYKNNLSDMQRAVQMCFDKSNGCMLFDLSYLVNNNWWNYIKKD